MTDDLDLVPTTDPTTERNASRLREKFAGLDSATELQVSFTAAGQQRVPHRLGRAPNGWRLLCRLSNQQIWDYAAPDAEYLYLEADGAVQARLEVKVGAQ